MNIVDKSKGFSNPIKEKGKPTREEKDLALAWMKDEISLNGAVKALRGKWGMGIYVRFCISLKRLYKEGRIKIIK